MCQLSKTNNGTIPIILNSSNEIKKFNNYNCKNIQIDDLFKYVLKYNKKIYRYAFISSEITP